MAGVLTRRYHGILFAALSAPLSRTVMLSRLTERVRLPDHTAMMLSGDEHVDGAPNLAGTAYLHEFRLDAGLPVWRYTLGDWVIEKSLLMPHHQNTVHVTYRLISSTAPKPVHATGLYRPGVEHGRGAAGLGEDSARTLTVFRLPRVEEIPAQLGGIAVAPSGRHGPRVPDDMDRSPGDTPDHCPNCAAGC